MDRTAIQAAFLGNADCSRCAVRELVLFADLNAEDFHLIHRPIDDLHYPKEGLLYRQGDNGNALYTLRSGTIKLVQYAQDGTLRIVRLLRAGDVAGLEALLGRPYQHDAVALEPIRVCRLPVEVLQRLNQHTPRLHKQLMERWQRALAEADASLTELSTGPARARVARLLLRLASPEQLECALLGREDMGAMLGITTETASRTIAAFKREGLVQDSAPDRVRCDIDRLSAVAGD
jgi:CRP/FNR family transcriptional regulator